MLAVTAESRTKRMIHKRSRAVKETKRNVVPGAGFLFGNPSEKQRDSRYA